MTQYVGFDSVDRASDPSHGTTLAQDAFNKITAVANYGPSFWGRYFGTDNSGFYTMNEDSAATNQAEFSSMKNIGVRNILVINSPGDVGGTAAQGTADGNAVCAGIISVLNNNPGKISIQANTLDIYLDVEANYAFSATYWSYWMHAVNYYQYNGSAPFYACCYCNPCDSYSNPCGVFGSYVVFAIWSNQPESCCSFCNDTPGFGPATCTDSGSARRSLWQYSEADQVCNCIANYPAVDLDSSNPNTLETSHMLALS